jgi:hypothetical protein
MEEWVTAWETFFNLGAGEATCDNEGYKVVDFSHNFNDLDVCFGWRCRWDELADRFKALIPEFRRKYYLNGSPRELGPVLRRRFLRPRDIRAPAITSRPD